ncbi:MAG: DUF6733 family protein [Myxococcota bacterium]
MNFHRLVTITAAFVAVVGISEPTQAQDVPAETSTEVEESKEGPPTSISVVLKQDIFFGFHAIGQVAVGLNDLVDVTFYTILWTRPGFGAGGGGADLWTEWGPGLNFKFLDGNLSVNPQFGLLNGTLLSGAGRGLFFEGIVPNLTVTYGDALFQGQLYAGFYIGLRELDDSSRNDFIHYWANAGVAPLSWLSIGAHWESLIQTRGAATNEVETVYQWIGPYIEARAAMGFIRFAGGADLEPEDTADFYQVSIGLSF